MAGCFESFGPASAIVYAFKERRELHLAKTMASFLAIQLRRQKWPRFDYLVPVPQTLTKTISRGFNPSLVLAKSLSWITGIPVAPLLKRKGPRLSSKYLPFEEREKFPYDLIQWKNSIDQYLEKSFLIIDDEAVTRGTLQATGNALQEACPSCVYAITFTVYE